jgi:hypothetical protein
MADQEQLKKEKAVETIHGLFTTEFKAYSASSGYEQRRRGQTFVCSVCSRPDYDSQGRSMKYKWLTVYPANKAVGCQFPHTVCMQVAYDIDDEVDIENIRAAVEREYDYIKDVDGFQ